MRFHCLPLHDVQQFTKLNAWIDLFYIPDGGCEAVGDYCVGVLGDYAVLAFSMFAGV